MCDNLFDYCRCTYIISTQIIEVWLKHVLLNFYGVIYGYKFYDDDYDLVKPYSPCYSLCTLYNM